MPGMRPLPKQRLMTRQEFEEFVNASPVHVFARQPYQVVPCACGDVNCHGWRFVELRRGAVRDGNEFMNAYFS